MFLALTMQALSLAVCCAVSTTPREKQENLWQDLFSNTDEWWDNRRSKKGPNSPDFRKKSSKEPLWLDSLLKPSWVDAQLAIIDQKKKKKKQKAHSAEIRQISQEIESLCSGGYLERAFTVLSRIDHLDTKPPPSICLSLLKACMRSKSAFHVKRVHSYLQQKQVKLSGLVGDYLTTTLAKCGCLDDAQKIFDRLPSRTVYAWTAMIREYVESGRSSEALQLFADMQEDGIEPDDHTFVSLLKACGQTRNLDKGKELHDAAREKGFASDAYIKTTLVSMYCNCGAISDAENVLCESNVCNIESVNAMLSAYVENCDPTRALLLFRQLQEEGIEADALTLNVALLACSVLGDDKNVPLGKEQSIEIMSLEISKALHADSKKKGFSGNLPLGTTLVKVYGKCGTIKEVQSAFQSLSKHDVVSWSAVLSAYVECGLGRQSLQLFRHMQQMGIEPDKQAFSIAFQACASLAEREDGATASRAKALEIGKALHLDAQTKGFTSDVFLGNTLVSMYGKCRDIVRAERAFDELPKRDTVSWNALLSLYTEQGMEEKALQSFFQMQEDCVVLNEVTLLCVLQSCSGTGFLEVARHINFIAASVEFDLNPLVSSALIHTYGMCASMVDALTVLRKCPMDDIVTWNACIAGYSREGGYDACMQLLKSMQEAGIKPDRITLCLIISVCAHEGLIEEGVEYFESMKRCYGVTQDLKHYVNLADLFARAGDFDRLEIVLRSIPMQPNSELWLCVLASCRAHGNMQFGKWAFDWARRSRFESSGAFVLLSNTLVDADDETAEVATNTAGKDAIFPDLTTIVNSMAGDTANFLQSEAITLQRV